MPHPREVLAAHLALTPTLTLWEAEARKADLSAADLEGGMNRASAQLNAFLLAGGEILFGTDVGYTDRYDTSDEYKLMSRGGMSYQQILTSLTTNPACRFGESTHSGRIAKDYDADLVILRGDPSQNTAAFSQVQYTIRNGSVIYNAAP